MYSTSTLDKIKIKQYYGLDSEISDHSMSQNIIKISTNEKSKHVKN